MGFSYNVNVLNQKGSPALYTDTFANRPAFGYAGRLFIANDTSAIYEDTGTAWVLIANVSSGAGTLQQVTTNGNTSNVGISITAGGLSTNSLTDTALTLGSVLFAGASGLVTQDNAAFYWDDTNNRLGINTTTPGNSLDIHFAGTGSTIGLNNTAGNAATIVFANTGTNKWRIGNSSTNNFDVINISTGTNAISIDSSTNLVNLIGALTAAGKIISSANGSTFGTSANGLYPLIIQSNTTGRVIQLINTLAGTAQITVSGTATSSSIGFNTYSTNDAFVITNNGFIGIGTALPSTTLDVVGSGVFSGSVSANAGNFTSEVKISSATTSSFVVNSTNDAAFHGFEIQSNGVAQAGMVALANTGEIKIGGYQTTNDYFPVIYSDGVASLTFGIGASPSATFVGSVTGTILNSTSGGSTQIFLKSTGGGSNRNWQLQTSETAAGDLSIMQSTTAGGSTYATKVNIGPTGSVAIGSSTFSATKLLITGTDQTSGAYTLICNDSSSNTVFFARNDGLINTGARASSPYNNSLAGRTVTVDASGTLGYLVSTRESKNNIESINDVSYIFNLRPVQFNYRKKDNLTNEYIEELEENINYGFIADEVEQVNKELVFYNTLEDGTKKLAGVEYNNMIALLTKAVQQQQTQINSLLKRIELLENK